MLSARLPAFLPAHPDLHFELLRCQYGGLLAGGRLGDALELARRWGGWEGVGL
jgi:hypothetical protein